MWRGHQRGGGDDAHHHYYGEFLLRAGETGIIFDDELQALHGGFVVAQLNIGQGKCVLFGELLCDDGIFRVLADANAGGVTAVAA